jgi:FtsP/CotA-like multicopper oxidase with cupredoxin domain
MLRWATLVVAAAAAGSTARTGAEVAPLEYEDTWVLRNVAAMPDGYPRQIIAVTPIAELRPIHTDPVHPWNDTMAVFPEIISIPGPAVRIQQGGRVRITVENRLHSPVSIHWHGIHMDHQAWMDGTSGFTECGIPQHGRFTYDFVVDQEPGTHWWHAHNKAEFVDGAWGAIIVEPREGVPDLINQRWGVEPDYDQLLFVGDWSHESWEDNEQKYLGRQGEYPGYDADRQRMSEPHLPHLPDYPWPTHSVILNGRGQFPCEGRYVSADDCRIIMEWGWVWWENQSLPRPEPNPARPNLCRGQCNPVRPPYVGQCGATPPAVLKCEAGGHVRLRLINSGAGLPMRVWIDRHELTIVARDGLPVEDSGPHVAVLLHSGVRFDVIVHCNQAAEVGSVFKIFSAFAIEFYPGITQRFSAVGWFPLAGYARLEYSDAPGVQRRARRRPHRHPGAPARVVAPSPQRYAGCVALRLVRPRVQPLLRSAGAGAGGLRLHLPAHLPGDAAQATGRLTQPGDPCGGGAHRGPHEGVRQLVEPPGEHHPPQRPAAHAWPQAGVVGGGRARASLRTLRAAAADAGCATRFAPPPPPARSLPMQRSVLATNLSRSWMMATVIYGPGVLGLPTSDERSFGHVDPRLVPYIAQIEYDAVNPKWYATCWSPARLSHV